jgi:hypothetical protein
MGGGHGYTPVSPTLRSTLSLLDFREAPLSEANSPQSLIEIGKQRLVHVRFAPKSGRSSAH